MADRGKVIREIQYCTKDCADPGEDECNPGKCRYAVYQNSYDYDCKEMLLKDALALLEEREPRLMTLDEALSADDFVWAEIYSTLKWRWCVICVRIGPVAGNEEVVKIEEDCGIAWTKNKSEYGKRGFLDGGWRCWTARPTEEQMRDTKWEDTDNG